MVFHNRGSMFPLCVYTLPNQLSIFVFFHYSRYSLLLFPLLSGTRATPLPSFSTTKHRVIKVITMHDVRPARRYLSWRQNACVTLSVIKLIKRTKAGGSTFPPRGYTTHANCFPLQVKHIQKWQVIASKSSLKLGVNPGPRCAYNKNAVPAAIALSRPLSLSPQLTERTG